MHPSARTTLTTALLGAALLVPSTAHAEDEVTLVLRQDPFEVTFHDLDGDGGSSAGDLYTWVAPIGTTDGRLGMIVGHHQIVDLPTDGPFREVRIGTSVIELGDGDAIALGGLVPVTTPLGQIEPGTELVNEVLGGTGAYLGAKGEIASVRGEDGVWTHTLSFRIADPSALTRTVRTATRDGVLEHIDQNADDTLGAGDVRVFNYFGSTTDGTPFETYGASVLVAGPGGDEGAIAPVGYSVQGDDSGVMVGIVHPPVDPITRRLTTTGVPPTPIVGGTGRYAGANGSYTVSRNEDGTYSGAFVVSTEATGSTATTLVLRSAVPEVVTLDRGEPGPSVGDQQSWVLPFTTEAGEPAGTAYGYLTAVRPAEDGTAVHIVTGLISIQLADGSTLLLADIHQEETALPKAADLAVRRPVLGGTGAWAGASGELVTTLDGSGGLVHTFTLRMPGAGM